MQKIYVCGPTVYSKVHIGNLKPILTFDIFIRSLNYLGEKVKYVNNITDIDDKIIKRAFEENITEKEVSEKYHAFYLKMLKKYNVQKPDSMPLVTEHIPEIIKFIEDLVAKGFAYESSGNVYFDILSVPGYGEVSNNKINNLHFESSKGKKNPGDFTLWKKTKIGIQYDAPWGLGRPGWHTECVVFVEQLFNNEPLDIHGGGIDLIFPHHENENIQFKAKFNKKIANKFVHVGLFNFNGEKMAKSIGNILDADEFALKHNPDTLRTIILNSSVTAPVNLTAQTIEKAKVQTAKYAKVFTKILLENKRLKFDEKKNKELATLFSQWKFAEAMKLINEKIKTFNRKNKEINYVQLSLEIWGMLNLIGYSFTNRVINHEERELYNSWKKMRKNKDFSQADILKEQLVKKELI